MSRLIILTGASGAGKTAIMDCLKTMRHSGAPSFLHFDSIGVPGFDEMQSMYGSPENWQRAKTDEWIQTIKAQFLNQGDVFFEGQIRIEFIKNALMGAHIVQSQVFLIDCSDEVRRQRLISNRQQPELATEQMMNWAKFLRDEAKREGVPVVGTSSLSPAEGAEIVLSSLSE